MQKRKRKISSIEKDKGRYVAMQYKDQLYRERQRQICDNARERLAQQRMIEAGMQQFKRKISSIEKDRDSYVAMQYKDQLN